MYSTCIFCHTSLGTNEAIEHFPVGRRLAFDAAKGRLWVVCKACERWNLTPLAERWEAIEECERLFSESKLRVSTEHIGLAKLREGLTLVRIGAPKRPEMAAWRYGDQFGRRRRRHIVAGAAFVATTGGVIVASIGSVAAAGSMLGLGGLVAMNVGNLLNLANILKGYRIVARMSVDGEQIGFSRYSMLGTTLRPNAEYGFELAVPCYLRRSLFRPAVITQWVRFTGNEALDAARILLPRINAAGANRKLVADALDHLEATPDPARLFAQMAGLSRANLRPLPKLATYMSGNESVIDLRARYRDALGRLPAAQRLAVEMALHENDERLAFEGELAALTARWKQAEEVAAISDDLLVPSGVRDRVRSMIERR